MSVCPLLCTHPLVYTDSCGRDGLSVTLVLVNALIFPGWRHCTDEGFRIRAYGVCEVAFGYRCRCQHAGQGEDYLISVGDMFILLVCRMFGVLDFYGVIPG